MNQAILAGAVMVLLRYTVSEPPGTFGTAASTYTPVVCCCKVASTRLAEVSATSRLGGGRLPRGDGEGAAAGEHRGPLDGQRDRPGSGRLGEHADAAGAVVCGRWRRPRL